MEPVEVTESTTTQKTICTGSPISFTLLVLALPLLVYLSVHKSNCRGASGLHAIDATRARWRGGTFSRRSIRPARPRSHRTGRTH